MVAASTNSPTFCWPVTVATRASTWSPTATRSRSAADSGRISALRASGPGSAPPVSDRLGRNPGSPTQSTPSMIWLTCLDPNIRVPSVRLRRFSSAICPSTSATASASAEPPPSEPPATESRITLTIRRDSVSSVPLMYT